jgi:putative flippase GtrA
MAASCTHHAFLLSSRETDMLNVRPRLTKLQSNRLWPRINFPAIVDRIRQFTARCFLIREGRSISFYLPTRIYCKYQRQIDYGLVGAFVTGLSFAVLYITIGVLHINPVVAYAIQSGIVLETRLLLNHLLTFRYQRIHFTWKQTLFAFVKYHVSRVVIVPSNLVLFSVLVYVSVPYVAAQCVCIAATIFANYIILVRFVYSIKRTSS